MANSIINPLVNPVLSDFDSHYTDLINSFSIKSTVQGPNSLKGSAKVSAKTSAKSTATTATTTVAPPVPVVQSTPVPVSATPNTNKGNVSVVDPLTASKNSALIDTRKKLAQEIVQVSRSGVLPGTQIKMPPVLSKCLFGTQVSSLCTTAVGNANANAGSNSLALSKGLNVSKDVSILNTTIHSYLCNCAKNRSKVLVLNFANFKYPGGKFLKGTFSQEESLCHISNLFTALCDCDSQFYANHRSNHFDDLYNSDCIYLKDVTLLKNLNGSFKKTLYTFDVLSMSAPNYIKYMKTVDSSNQALQISAYSTYEVALVSRIQDLMRVLFSLPVKYDAVVLGAFGCGHYGNDTKQVAHVFSSILSNLYISGATRNCPFDKLDFIISDSTVYQDFHVGFFSKP